MHKSEYRMEHVLSTLNRHRLPTDPTANALGASSGLMTFHNRVLKGAWREGVADDPAFDFTCELLGDRVVGASAVRVDDGVELSQPALRARPRVFGDKAVAFNSPDVEVRMDDSPFAK